ncbi:MAG: glucose-1-phosphate adenylyltransferase [Oscillospiraceae bacterium]|nr:glucose-1-phosphate adenylyltransferase [Oscillospiraceae bacterium]
MKKECVAMLLAGGQGSRLYVLTTNIAKPAVPFGGKYRIIDFPLSNCINSDIDTVGVLTQYQPHELNAYIGSGQPWDLDRLDGGVHILPPYQKNKGATWYKGSANAVYQNITFVDHYDPDLVLVICGDHIYKMDYSVMIDCHKRSGAACTIAAMEVDLEEASRYGVMNVNADDTIWEFEEKPKKPKSNLISMGIYVFDWAKLRQYLIDDDEDAKSKNDFGQNILPNMLAAGEKMKAYRFNGYWKDVGTIDSLWEANMDMLATSDRNVFDSNMKVYGRNPTAPPHYIGPDAKVSHSLVTEGCNVYGTVENSVLFHGVTVEPGAEIKYSILMPGTVVKKNAKVSYAIVAERAVICEHAQVGAEPSECAEDEEWGIAVVASGVAIGPHKTLGPKEMADADLM